MSLVMCLRLAWNSLWSQDSLEWFVCLMSAVILAKNSLWRRKASAFMQKELSLGGVTSGDRCNCVILEFPLWDSGQSNYH